METVWKLELPARRRGLTRFLPEQRRFWFVFCLCCLTAAVLFLPWVIWDGGLFHYAGDFNGQQISFYQYTNSFVKQGGGYSWQTDLGTGLVNGYSFYLVGSPFWWLSLLFPARAMPYLMVPFLCLKFAVAGGGAWLWLRRYAKGDWAVLGAVLYAFSGFSVYSIFFNHFMDVVALFPYLLWALDRLVLEGRGGWFAVLAALNLVNNYFFFAGQIVFLAIYFFAKLSAGEYRPTLPRFGRVALESVLGMGMGCVLLIPAAISLSQNPRTVDLSSGYGFLLYGKVQQYFAIFTSLFLAPDPPYLTNLWTEGAIKWTNLSAYLPLVSAAGAIAWLRQRPGTGFKRILLTSLLFALVPVLNSSFYMLNSSYYARWFYMPVLIMAACTACGLEQELPQHSSIRLSLVVCLATLAFALAPKYENEAWSLGALSDPVRYAALLAVTVLGLAVYGMLLCAKPRRQGLALLAAVLACTLVYGGVHMGFTKLYQQENDKNYVQQCYVEGPGLGAALPGDHFYRTDSYKCYDNIGLWTGKPNLQFFCSTVTPSILEFYPSVDVKRDVSSKPEPSHYALRGLLSAEYLLMPLDEEQAWAKEKVQGYTRSQTVGSYAVYRNENYVPMGFSYDWYITEDRLESVAAANRANLLLRAVVLPEEETIRFADILEPLPAGQLTDTGYARYRQDVEDRRAMACRDFTASGSGFTAHFTSEKSRLVFFSVPYEEGGFTATVNGSPVPVEKVNNGLSAVRVEAGENEIVFTYHTPGLALSLKVTAAAWALFALYLFLASRPRRPKQGPVWRREAGEGSERSGRL